MRAIEKYHRKVRKDWEKLWPTILDSENKIEDFSNGKFAEMIQEHVQCKHVELVRNLQSALTVALKAMEVDAKDLILLPALGPLDLLEGVIETQASIVLIDLHPKTYTIDVLDLQKKLKTLGDLERFPKKIVMAMDSFALPADYPALNQIAERYHLNLVEIASHGLGGEIRQEKVGSFGDLSILNFSQKSTVKALFEGACICTNHSFLEKQVKRWNGTGYNRDTQSIDTPALNRKIHPLESHFLRVALESYLAFENEKLQEYASFYENNLYDEMEIPFVPGGFRSGWQSYVVLCPNQTIRGRFIHEMHLAGYSVNIPEWYNYENIFRNMNLENLILLSNAPVSANLINRWVNIPLHPYIDFKEIQEIVSNIRRFWKDNAKDE